MFTASSRPFSFQGQADPVETLGFGQKKKNPGAMFGGGQTNAGSLQDILKQFTSGKGWNFDPGAFGANTQQQLAGYSRGQFGGAQMSPQMMSFK